MFLNGYPYTDFHEMNADFLLRTVQELKKGFAEFTASNSLIFAEPLLHDLTKTYAKNTIVLDPEGNAYISLQNVPEGIQLANADYWLMVFNFEEYTEKANKNFTDNYFRDMERAPYALIIGDWVVLNDVLYKVVVDIPEDGLFEIGTNIVHFTIEQFLKDFIASVTQTINDWHDQMVNTINQYKNDIDASEALYKSQVDADVLAYKTDLQNQFEQVLAGATVNSEVINARVGYDGTEYTTLKNAITGQIENVVNVLDIVGDFYYSSKYVANGTYPTAYSYNTTTAFAASKIIKKGELIVKLSNKNKITTAVTFGIGFTDLSGKVLKFWDMTGFEGYNIYLDYVAPDDGFVFISCPVANAVQIAFNTTEQPGSIPIYANRLSDIPTAQFPVEGNTYTITADSTTVLYTTWNTIIYKFIGDEVINGRIGANGVTYDSLGDAIRSQFNSINNQINGVLTSFDNQKFSTLGDAVNDQFKSVDDIINDIAAMYFSSKYADAGSYPTPYTYNTTTAYAISNIIKKGEIITRIRNKNNITTAITFGIAFTNMSGEVLKFWDMTGFTGTTFKINYEVPEDGFLVISCPVANAVQVAFNTTEQTGSIGIPMNRLYDIPSGQFPVEGTTYSIENSSGSTIYSTFNVEVLKYSGKVFNHKLNNKFYNTKIAFLGDSLTAGYLEGGGYADDPYPKITSELLGLKEYQMVATASSSMSVTGNATQPFTSRVAQIDSDCDYVIVMGGTNDHVYATPLGDMTDTTDVGLYGAMYKIFTDIQALNSRIQVIFILPPQKTWVGANAIGLTFDDYLEAITKMCHRCSVPLIDIHNESDLTVNLPRSYSTYYGSGLHLTQDGYAYLGKRVAEMIITK